MFLDVDRRAWRALAAAQLGWMLDAMDFLLFTYAVIQIREEFSLSRPMMGVVGTRRMTHYGRRAVSHFVPGFVRSGIVTVSGLALGVDAAVAKDTLEAGGRTIAVLGQGLSTIYPQANAVLADKIVKNGGLLMSEFPLDYPPNVYTFPARNRIIAALGAGVIWHQSDPSRRGNWADHASQTPWLAAVVAESERQRQAYREEYKRATGRYPDE